MRTFRSASAVIAIAAGLSLSAVVPATAAPTRVAGGIPIVSDVLGAVGSVLDPGKELTQFEDTGAKNVTSVHVTPCVNEPCTLQRGQDYEFRFTFTAQQAADTPRLNVMVNLGGMWVDLAGYEERDMCEDASISPSCTIAAGQTYTVSYRIAVPQELPAGETRVKFEVYHGSPESRHHLAGFVMPAVVR